MQTKNQVAAQQQKVRNNNAVVRMQQRIAAVQQLRASKHAARVAARNQQAFVTQVQQLAQQYGVNVQQVINMHNSNTTAARANSATANPSNALVVVAGVPLKPCKAVHALCAANPTATRAQILGLCAQHGINQATASTQYGVYKKQQKVAQ